MIKCCKPSCHSKLFFKTTKSCRSIGLKINLKKLFHLGNCGLKAVILPEYENLGLFKDAVLISYCVFPVTSCTLLTIHTLSHLFHCFLPLISC